MKLSFFRTIRTHLLLLVLISVLPALGIMIYSGLRERSQAINMAKVDALHVVKNFSYDHERAVESTRQFLMTLARVPDIRNMNAAASNDLLSQLLKQNPLYSTLFVVTADGFVHATGLPPLPPTPISVQQRRYFQQVTRIDDFAVGEYAICPAVKRPVLHFAYPIKDADGRFKGAVALSLDLARYAKMFPMDKLPQGSTLSLSDYKGIQLYRYPGKEDNIPKPEAPDVTKTMLSQGEEGVFTYTGTDKVKRLNAYKRFQLSSKESPYLFMRIGIPEGKALLPAKSALLTNVMLLMLAVIGVMFVAWFLGNATIVKRLGVLVAAARRLGQGDLKARTALDYQRDELGELGKAFDEMAEALEMRNLERQQAEETIKREISERIRSEEAIKESEQKFRDLAEKSPVGVYLIQDGAFKYVNAKFAEMHDYTVEELIDKEKPLSLVFRDDWPVVEEQIKKLNSGDTEFLHYEFRGITKNKNVITLELYGSRTIYQGKPAFIGTMVDITDRKRLEAQLLQSQKMEAIGTLAGGIAHDFNNLLMTMLGYNSLMLMDKDPHDPDYEKLKIIEGQIHSGADLTKQLLGFARGGKYEIKPTNLNELLAMSSDMFGRTRKEISIYMKQEKNLWPVEVDRGQIEQVFLNLFVNAWQAMPAGGNLYLETRNIVLDEDFPNLYSLNPGKYVKISITDTGTGMDEATRQRIFEPFFTTKEMGRGAGLGLASAYGVIKNHAGIINVYSEKGKGTTFTIYLPASEKQWFKEKEIPDVVLKGTEKILLVDDQDAVLNVGEELLKKLGHTVFTATSGEEAITFYTNNKDQIDLVILDMVMPVMGGGETYIELKKINPEIKVILASGYSLDGEAANILSKGCNGFIQKPFTIGELSRKVREVLD